MKSVKLYIRQIINKIVNIMLDDEAVLFDKLPATVKTFVYSNFPNLSIDFIMEGKDAYTLMFNDGTEVTINQDGTCQCIDYKF